jgi:hypothetical protein
MKEYSMYLMSRSKGAVHHTSYRSPPSFHLLKARYSFESKRNFTLIKTSEILQPQKRNFRSYEDSGTCSDVEDTFERR